MKKYKLIKRVVLGEGFFCHGVDATEVSLGSKREAMHYPVRWFIDKLKPLHGARIHGKRVRLIAEMLEKRANH